MTPETLGLALASALVCGAIAFAVLRAWWRSRRRRREFVEAYVRYGQQARAQLASERPRVLGEPALHRFARGDRYPTRMGMPAARPLSVGIPPAPPGRWSNDPHVDRWLRGSLEVHVRRAPQPRELRLVPDPANEPRLGLGTRRSDDASKERKA